MAQIPQSDLRYIVNHVVLPPQLPGSPEPPGIAQSANEALLKCVLESVQVLLRHAASDEVQAWEIIQNTLLQWSAFNGATSLPSEVLSGWLAQADTNDVVSLLIRSQNACITIRIQTNRALFECFELSPTSDSVIKCKSSLRRSFPAGAVAVPRSFFKNKSFQEELVSALRKLDVEDVEDMAAKSQKAGHVVTEVRDTVHPGLVTEMLMATLAALGNSVSVPQVHKRTRDDVIWDGNILPWRRSCSWLALRVTLQTTLSRNLPESRALAGYKNLILLLLTRIMNVSLASRLPIDLCSIIQAKISRRSFKLGADLLDFVGNDVLAVGRIHKRQVQDVWNSVQDSEKAIRMQLDTSTVQQDTTLTLTNCGPCINWVLESAELTSVNREQFSPNCPRLLTYQEDGLPALGSYALENDRIFALAELEAWVAASLSAWTAKVKENPVDDKCLRLGSLAINYKKEAIPSYRDSPEQLSVMLLTLAEIWVAIDTIVSEMIPLLREFGPELSNGLFYPLLMPKLGDMVRLKAVEDYICIRHEASNFSSAIYSTPKPACNHCFASRYFETSDKHKELRRTIEVDATKRREQKKMEWKAKKNQFDCIKAEAAALSCTTTIDDWGNCTHDPKCKKCRLESEAKNLRIKVHEWPLPEQERQCQAVVFEIDCPPAFSIWRDTTWMLLQDLGRSAVVPGAPPAVNTSNYSGLTEYSIMSTSRLSLASRDKSFLQTHYSQLQFPTDLSQVCCRNALSYAYFDNQLKVWAPDQVEIADFSFHCIGKLPDGPYLNLQEFVNSTAHHQNTVIADQDKCGKDLTLQELIAFGSLRSDGERTQWPNILRELGATNLNLNAEAVCTLITQAATEAGSMGQMELRLSHAIFEDSHFCLSLLASARSLLSIIETNWKSGYSMMLVLVITLRVLSLGKEADYRLIALEILRNCRKIVSDWIEGLEKLLEKGSDDTKNRNLQTRLLEVGLLGKKTYDVDDFHINEVMASAEDLRHWVRFSMIVRHNSPGCGENLPGDLRRLLLNDKKLAYRIAVRMSLLVAGGDSQGLDHAINLIWPGFKPSSTSWSALSTPNERWVQRSTLSTATQDSQVVSYNILEGELLVDGNTMGALPREYTQSSLYARIFGAHVFAVVASNMTGMLYMTAREMFGHQLHFGKRGEHINIRVRKLDQIWEIIPHEQFRHDFPTAFIDDYVHWLDISAHVLEFRSFSKLYESKPEWLLHCASTSPPFLGQGDQKLVDFRSRTANSVAFILAPLEIPSHIHITLTNRSCMKIRLPRLGLHFSLNSNGNLVCRELGKIIDPNQFIGTFIGLQSKMTFCQEGGHSQGLDRMVIVPLGTVHVSKQDTYVKVSITNEDKTVPFVRFQVDSILGRLRSDGSLQSRLYQAYLHAVTSGMLPDPLTDRSGIQEALTILEAQRKQIWKPVDEEEARLLQLLSALTPHRQFYPSHLQVTQQVSWSREISFLSQHDDFSPLCMKLLLSGNRFGIFHTENQRQICTLKHCGEDHLLERARLRNSTTRTSRVLDRIDLCANDEDYSSRDSASISDRGKRTYRIATLIVRWPSKIDPTEDIRADFKRWGSMSGFGEELVLNQPLVDLLQISLSTWWARLRTWCCRCTAQDDRYKLLFTFATIAYGQNMRPLRDIRTILAFAFITDLQNLTPPQLHGSYDLCDGKSPQEQSLAKIIAMHGQPYITRARLTKAAQRQERAQHQLQVETQALTVARHYISTWPRVCSPISTLDTSLLAMKSVQYAVESQFSIYRRNRELEGYLEEVQVILDAKRESGSYPASPNGWRTKSAVTRAYNFCVMPDISLLMSCQAPQLQGLRVPLHIMRETSLPVEDEKLASVLSAAFPDTNTSTINDLRQRYKGDLQGSLNAFHNYEEPVQPRNTIYNISAIRAHYEDSKMEFHRLRRSIEEAVQPSNTLSCLLELGGYWPRVTLVDLLRSIALTANLPSNERWSDCLFQLGRLVTIHQRARRLVLAAEAGNIADFSAEAEHIGSVGWDARMLPDWLLFEIENDLLIRPLQARVALEMIRPNCSSNMLTQLNMGEGKSSVIVPIVAAALANGHQLSRVLVLKSLMRQMMDTLSQRLSGVVDRQIYFIPFSRKTPMETTLITQMQGLYEECLTSHGILLTQPEFLLSFKLMGIERLTSGNTQLGNQLLATQNWLDKNARDLLDESDEILDVKFQLIYTIGHQRPMDGQPDRWLLIHGILDLIEKHVTAMAYRYSKEIEAKKRSDAAFPAIRLLSTDAGTKLISKVLGDIVESKLPGLNLGSWDLTDTGILHYFLKNLDVGEPQCAVVLNRCGGDESLLKKLLLIRGLIAHGTLLSVLTTKRWGVNYGLHPSRCLVAVPYRAKGMPAPTAEFGHPDVTIILTCLAYYYSGLSDHQMRVCFDILQKIDDPSSEYLSWSQRSSRLPHLLRNWNAVNLDDEQQCYDVLFPALRYSKRVADFYMTHIVFPREGKEFDEKLSTSGWDIPLKPTSRRLTTGFSGTNDNRFLLPDSIVQKDLPELRHTSGRVLHYVLRSTLGYECAKDQNGRQLSDEGLLRFITRIDRRAQVLIDVGAQIVEITNVDVVKTWLLLNDDVEAGVFFDDHDKVMIVSRDNGKIEPFATSSFSGRLDRCVVFMDEIHTRGTDLKLPREAHAVVTLGPRLTKDRLVQACMRLRQLAHGQTLLFVAPPEVHRNILGSTGKSGSEVLTGYDILTWALMQSCLHIERSEPLQIMQGRSYYHRQKAAQQYPIIVNELGHDDGKTATGLFVEKEEQSIQHLYAPLSMPLRSHTGSTKLDTQCDDPGYHILQHRWRQLKDQKILYSDIQEEHEREISHEIEQEQEVIIQRPPPAKPVKELVDKNLTSYIRGGGIFEDFISANDAIISKSSSVPFVGSDQIWRDIRVTKGFCLTIDSSTSGFCDDYFRPVNWILTRKSDAPVEELLILSQYEVNQLLPVIKHPSSKVILHSYEPRVTRAMSSVDTMTEEPISQATQDWLQLTTSLRRQLHLFAGQLYIDTYEEYSELRDELSSIVPDMSSLKEWIGIRRRGQKFSGTHIGRLVSGWNLQEEDFDSPTAMDLDT